MLGGSLGFIYGKVQGSDENIKLGSTDGKVIGTILGNVYGIIIGFNVVTELGYLDGFFIFYGDMLKGIFLGVILISTDGKLLGSDGGIKMGSTDG